MNLAERFWSQCSAFTFGDTGRSLSFNKERELFTELLGTRRVKHVLQFKLTQRRAAIFKLA